MSCYWNQLTELLREIGLEVNDSNRKALSRRVSEFTGYDEVHCPNIRRELSAILEDADRRRKLGEYLRSGR
ncbi:MAG: hypothetical protein HYR85_04495 [Planctomycetes bacterium]|nr:hypothetical protein [Planctomycetota bacterium]MBI3844097.1 hypothetical protein [Planctomycetota bacterium]